MEVVALRVAKAAPPEAPQAPSLLTTLDQPLEQALRVLVGEEADELVRWILHDHESTPEANRSERFRRPPHDLSSGTSGPLRTMALPSGERLNTSACSSAT